MCDLKIFSKTTPFTDLLSDNIVQVYSLRQIGDIYRKNVKPSDCYRASISVSNAEWDEYDKQVEDAVSFLNNHGNYINSIIKSHNAYDTHLDFAIYSRLGGDEEIVNHNDCIPMNLINLCSKFGIFINMSYYRRDYFE